MSRCPNQVVSLKRDPQFLIPQASLVFYRHTAVGMKGQVELAQQGIEPGPVMWKRYTLPLDHWAFVLFIYEDVNFQLNLLRISYCVDLNLWPFKRIDN
ncbi:hypothetical protein TNCV_1086071 [Trichonephila clavipes]|nr:hypothetical protein TNCV_1086071 [Trichonephila clavipes]